MRDSILEEIRQTRLKIEQECAEKKVSYREHLLDIQIQYKDRLVVPAIVVGKRQIG